MPLLQYTFIFDMPGHGFTETHWRDGAGSETLLQAFAIGQELGRRRQVMSGAQTVLQAVRISNADIAGRLGTSQIKSWPGNSSHDSAASNVALNVLIGDENNAHTKQTQFRGFWDEEEITGGAPAQLPAFNNAFDSWAQYFVAQGFGWRGINTDTPYPITGYAVTAAGVVTVTVEGNLAGVLPANAYRSVRFSGVNGGNSQINGAQVVMLKSVAGGVSTVELKFPMALVPFAGTGLMHVYTKTFRAATALSMQRVGKRQAGAPLLRSRGRGPKRQRT